MTSDQESSFIAVLLSIVSNDYFSLVIKGEWWRKNEEKGGNLLCSSKNVSIFAADFAAHVLLTLMLMR